MSEFIKQTQFNKFLVFLRQYGSFTTTLSILLFAGSGGFYQLTSGLFYCGINAAMPEILYWSIVIGCQSAIFMVAPLSKRAEKLYLISQVIALPFLVWVLAQLADTYSRPFIAVGVMLAIYCYLRFLTIRLWRSSSNSKQRLSPLELLTEGSIFILTTLLIQSTLAFVILHTQGALLTDLWFFGIFIFSAMLGYFLVRKGCSLFQVGLPSFPPLFLLVFILLRAKLPDQAYDSLFYKATIPLMIADWRTALTGVIDHTLLGTNFLEIINSQIRIFDPTYSPALTTALAFMGLWIIAPWAAAAFSQNKDGSGNLARNAMILLVVSLTEPLTAAGTAYQEPFLILLIAASVLAGPLGWFMIASAVSVKITTLFFIPFWLLWRVMTVDREAILPLLLKLMNFFHLKPIKSLNISEQIPNHIRPQRKYVTRAAVMICLFLAFTVAGEQFYRNYVFTGRIFAPSESLVSITDPNGQILKRPDNNQVFDSLSKGSSLSGLTSTAIHILTLDKLIKPDELGFHIMPSSRLPVVAFLLCIFLMFFRSFRTDRYFASLAISYAVSFVIFLGFFSQGRHLAVASAFAIFVVVAMLTNLTKKYANSSVLLTWIALGVTFFAISDQMVGSYINNGWECGRPLLATPVRSEYEKPNSEVEKVLAEIVQEYRTIQKTTNGVIPSIICEPKIERLSYFGANYVYSSPTQAMLKNYLDVDSKRVNRLPHSLLAICFEDEQFFTDLISDRIRPQYIQHAKVGNISIMVSTPLLSGAIAESITKKAFTPLQLITGNKIIAYDFVENWLDGKLTDESRMDTPNGKGAFQLTFDGVDSAVLTCPNSIQFSKVLFEANDSIELEYAMPHHNSSGIEVRLTVKTKDKQHIVELPISPRSGAETPMDWKQTSIKLPSNLSGEGELIISALSESGDSGANRIVFRNLAIQRLY